jgi:hypothetical protein
MSLQELQAQELCLNKSETFYVHLICMPIPFCYFHSVGLMPWLQSFHPYVDYPSQFSLLIALLSKPLFVIRLRALFGCVLSSKVEEKSKSLILVDSREKM